MSAHELSNPTFLTDLLATNPPREKLWLLTETRSNPHYENGKLQWLGDSTWTAIASGTREEMIALHKHMNRKEPLWHPPLRRHHEAARQPVVLTRTVEFITVYVSENALTAPAA